MSYILFVFSHIISPVISLNKIQIIPSRYDVQYVVSTSPCCGLWVIVLATCKNSLAIISSIFFNWKSLNETEKNGWEKIEKSWSVWGDEQQKYEVKWKKWNEKCVNKFTTMPPPATLLHSHFCWCRTFSFIFDFPISPHHSIFIRRFFLYIGWYWLCIACLSGFFVLLLIRRMEKRNWRVNCGKEEYIIESTMDGWSRVE